LKAAYHAQSKIGWENLVKGRIAQEWIRLIETHYVNQGYKLKARDWAPKFIGALWEHTQRVWKFGNTIYDADQNEQIARYKREEQQIRMDKIWARHLELQGRLQQNQLMLLGVAGRNVLTRSRVPATGRAERIGTIIDVKTGRWLKQSNSPSSLFGARY
jgi:hypothetical protein